MTRVLVVALSCFIEFFAEWKLTKKTTPKKTKQKQKTINTQQKTSKTQLCVTGALEQKKSEQIG